MEDYHVDRADESDEQHISVRNRESEESGTSLCNLAFIESDSSAQEGDSVVSSSNNNSDAVVCNTFDVSSDQEEHLYSNTEEGIGFPHVNQDYVDSDTDGGLENAMCSSSEHVDPADESVQCIFVKNREVDLKTSFCNLEFLGSDPFSNTIALDGDSVVSSSNASNVAACNTIYVSCNTSQTSSIATVEVEEYRYSDPKEGIELVELRYPPLLNKDSVDSVDSDTDFGLENAQCTYSDKRNSFKRNSVKWRGDSMDSELLYEELKSHGIKSPVPITETTKPIYLRLLSRLRIKAKEEEQPEEQQQQPEKEFSRELQKFVDNKPGLIDFRKEAKDLDRDLVDYFKSRLDLIGHAKKSCNYLLLDPRVTRNLRLNESQDEKKLFERFLSGIFYIGKGTVTRRYKHLHEAFRSLPQSQPSQASKKEERILDIWKNGFGVVSIPVFHDTLSDEALCREAAMIEAIGLSNITNEKPGEYHGDCCMSWTPSKKQRWGIHLLYRAFHIFLHEGERQIRPVDL